MDWGTRRWTAVVSSLDLSAVTFCVSAPQTGQLAYNLDKESFPVK